MSNVKKVCDWLHAAPSERSIVITASHAIGGGVRVTAICEHGDASSHLSESYGTDIDTASAAVVRIMEDIGNAEVS